MVSPYLRRLRPARQIIEELIAAREAELARTPEPARQPVEAALAHLRRELARLGEGARA